MQLWLFRKFSDCCDLSKSVTCNSRIGKFCLERPYTNDKCKELAQYDFSYLVFIYVLPVLHFMRFNHVAPKPGVLAFGATPPCNLGIECHTWQAICHWHNKWHNFIDNFLGSYASFRWNSLYATILGPFVVLLMCSDAVHLALPAASQPGVVDGSCPYLRVILSCPTLCRCLRQSVVGRRNGKAKRRDAMSHFESKNARTEGT